MLCYSEEKDPRKCLNEGKEVTRCGIEFFQKVKTHCAEQYTQYWKCVDLSGHDMHLKKFVQILFHHLSVPFCAVAILSLEIIWLLQ